MTNAQEKILLETNSSVHQLIGILKGGNGGGIEKISHDNSDDIEVLQKESVTKDECRTIRKTGVSQKRNNFLVVKDILIILIAVAAIATPIIVAGLK